MRASHARIDPPSLHFQGVSRPVLGYLEAQKTLDRIHSFRVLAPNSNASTLGDFFVPVVNLVFQLNHDRDAGRRLVMYETGDVEVTGLERGANVLQVHADVPDAGLIVA
jgi:hypothetical protein